MALAKQLIKTVDRLLKQFDATDRAVYKRIVTRTGGDQLIGRPGSVTYADTLLDPQPAVELVTAATKMTIVLAGASMAEVGDYILTVSPTAMSRSDLRTDNTLLIFKDSAGNVEEMLIISVDPAMVNGQDVVFEVTVRSKKR